MKGRESRVTNGFRRNQIRQGVMKIQSEAAELVLADNMHL